MTRRKLNVALIGHDFMGRAHFIRAVADGQSLRPTFEDGLQNQRVLDAIERSAGTGRWEKIAERTNG